MRDVQEVTGRQGLEDEHGSPDTGTDDFPALPHPDTWRLREFFQDRPPEGPPVGSRHRFPAHSAAKREPLGGDARGHRKVAAAATRHRKRTAGDWVSLLTMGAVVVVVAAVCVLGGTVTQRPLRHAAGGDSLRQLAPWWPLLVYGPWTAASLSILRAVQHRRRARHAWCVLLAFSALAVMLCVGQAPRAPLGAVVAALPVVAMVTSFHLLVRQVTLTRAPRHAAADRRPAASREARAGF